MVVIPKKYKGYKFSVDNRQRYFGTTDDAKKTVTINVKKSLKVGGVKELKDTIAHEKMHVEHPNMSERAVEKHHKETSIELAIKSLL